MKKYLIISFCALILGAAVITLYSMSDGVATESKTNVVNNTPGETETACSWPGTGATVTTDLGHSVVLKDRWSTAICQKNKGIMATWASLTYPLGIKFWPTHYYPGSGPSCIYDYDRVWMEVLYYGTVIKTQSYEYKWGKCTTHGEDVIVMLEHDDCGAGYTEVVFSDGLPRLPEVIYPAQLSQENTQGTLTIGGLSYPVIAQNPSAGWCYQSIPNNVPCPGNVETSTNRDRQTVN